MGWGPTHWEALGVNVQAVATGAAALAAAYTYRRSRRSESARWTEEQVNSLLLGGGSANRRVDLEFRFLDMLDDYVQLQLTGVPPSNVLDEAQLMKGADLDALLIGFEHLLTLARHRSIRRSDIEADFDYWTRDLLNRAEYASLRLYIQRFGFRELARQLKREDPTLLAVYGTLRQGSVPVDDSELPSLRTVRSGVRVAGTLYDTGEYPAAVVDRRALWGLRPAASHFTVDLVEIGSDDPDAALSLLDRYEEASAHDWSGLYRRLFVPLDHGGAWIYDWTGPTDPLVAVEAGEWRQR